VIYLDHHAKTPLSDAAREAMEHAREVAWANPSSVHRAGRAARAVLEQARDRVAAAVGARPADVTLTSGGTEAVSLGVLGAAAGRRRVLTTALEHPAVARAVERLGAAGARVERLGVPGGLAPEAAAVADGADPETLVAVQWVNHEVGTVLPVRAWAGACRGRGAVVFVDATQALGKVPVDVGELGADLVALAASKVGGPAGAGALWVRRELELAPLLAGGAQERGRRPGTPDVVAAAGFGAACERVPARLASMERCGRLRDRLERWLVDRGAAINGREAPRVATVTHASLRGHRGDALVAALDLEGVCASSGAACSSGMNEPSEVLLAAYPDEPWRARDALRLSLGPETTDADVAGALEALDRVLSRA